LTEHVDGLNDVWCRQTEQHCKTLRLSNYYSVVKCVAS